MWSEIIGKWVLIRKSYALSKLGDGRYKYRRVYLCSQRKIKISLHCPLYLATQAGIPLHQISTSRFSAQCDGGSMPLRGAVLWDITEPSSV